MISLDETLTSDIVCGLTPFSALDRWKRRTVEIAMRVARTKLSAIRATMAMHTSVSGQWESVNESRRVGGRGVGPAGQREDVSEDNDSLPGSRE